MSRALDARERLIQVVAEWTDEDVLRLDALCALGRPAEVVRRQPADVREEPGDAPGCVGTRSAYTRESATRADVLHAWRMVAELCGLPLPAAHEVGASETRRACPFCNALEGSEHSLACATRDRRSVHYDKARHG